jgi:hypothetical protein
VGLRFFFQLPLNFGKVNSAFAATGCTSRAFREALNEHAAHVKQGESEESEYDYVLNHAVKIIF